MIFMGNQLHYHDIDYKNPPLLLSKQTFCLHAYLVTNSGAKCLLELAKHSTEKEYLQYSGITPIDCMIIEEMKIKNTPFKWTCWINPDKPDSSHDRNVRNTGIVFQDTSTTSTITN